jgi:hypothetical protein
MRTLCLFVVVGLAAPVLAQEAASTPQAAGAVDEVIVPGSRPQDLRVEIERLERVVYERWNGLEHHSDSVCAGLRDPSRVACGEEHDRRRQNQRQ